MELVEQRIRESIGVKQRILDHGEIPEQLKAAAELVRKALAGGGKVLFCGNGGSASDALHLTGELVGRFQKERAAMAAVCLNADVASMTAIANDYGYEEVFSRGVEALLKPGDVLVGISTSGNSENVYRAVIRARELGGKTIAFLGKDGGKISAVADISLVVPDTCTARIQESHIMLGHILCELVEE